MFLICVGLVVLHSSALFANVQRGRKVSVLFLYCRIKLAIINKGAILGRGSLVNTTKLILMISKVLISLFYYLRFSPELILCIGDAYPGLHVNQACAV